jgi:TonB-dependent SusC/RagA subfamily outer membrane receptor
MKYFIGFIVFVASSTISFSQIRCVPSILPTDSKPLVVVDGKVLPELVKGKSDSTKLVDPLNEIDANEIDKIDVLKNEVATALYGETGKNGVIVITTKAYSQKSKKQ